MKGVITYYIDKSAFTSTMLGMGIIDSHSQKKRFPTESNEKEVGYKYGAIRGNCFSLQGGIKFQLSKGSTNANCSTGRISCAETYTIPGNSGNEFVVRKSRIHSHNGGTDDG